MPLQAWGDGYNEFHQMWICLQRSASLAAKGRAFHTHANSLTKRSSTCANSLTTSSSPQPSNVLNVTVVVFKLLQICSTLSDMPDGLSWVSVLQTNRQKMLNGNVTQRNVNVCVLLTGARTFWKLG